jgi:hypothetical protein
MLASVEQELEQAHREIEEKRKQGWFLVRWLGLNIPLELSNRESVLASKIAKVRIQMQSEDKYWSVLVEAVRSFRARCFAFDNLVPQRERIAKLYSGLSRDVAVDRYLSLLKGSLPALDRPVFVPPQKESFRSKEEPSATDGYDVWQRYPWM